MACNWDMYSVEVFLDFFLGSLFEFINDAHVFSWVLGSIPERAGRFSLDYKPEANLFFCGKLHPYQSSEKQRNECVSCKTISQGKTMKT